jgi:hypothetical protein
MSAAELRRGPEREKEVPMTRILWTSMFALAAASPAMAQENPPPGEVAPFCKEGYVHADTDDDRLISNEELQAAIDAEWEALDTDRSGDLTNAEVVACLNLIAGTQSAATDRSAENMAEADADGDGMLSAQEFMDAAQAAYDDIHSDPSLSADDPRVMVLRRYVFLTPEEAGGPFPDMTSDDVAARSAQAIRDLDTNSDEMIDEAEWSRQDTPRRDIEAQINMRTTEIDTDRSGTVSEEEYRQSRMDDLEAAREAALSGAEGGDPASGESDGGESVADVPVVYYRYESTF